MISKDLELKQYLPPKFSDANNLDDQNSAQELAERKNGISSKDLFAGEFLEVILPPFLDELTPVNVQVVMELLNLPYDCWIDMQERFALEKQKILEAEELILIGASNGLGDELQAAKFALAIQKATGKKIRCIVSSKVLPLCQNTECVQFESFVDPQSLLNENVFIFNLNILAKPERILGKISYQKLFNQGKIFSIGYPTVSNDIGQRFDFLQSIKHKLRVNNSESINDLDLEGLALFEAMGFHLESKNLMLPLVERESIPLSPGMVILPDAAESTYGTNDNGLFRPHFKDGVYSPVQDSVKILPVIVWEEIFTEMVNSLDPQNITIGIGTSHTTHSVQVLAAAEKILGQAGWNVMSWRGEITGLRDLIQAADGVVTMDSVTAHLSNLLIKELHQKKLPSPKLLTIFNGDAFEIDDYGVRGLSAEDALILHLRSAIYEKGSRKVMNTLDAKTVVSAMKQLFIKSMPSVT